MPANLIGLPVTARIDSAAPPRASPSMRVRITPRQLDLAAEALGDVDRVLPGQAVDHEQGLGRARGGGDGLHLGHQRVVDVEPAGGVEHQDVIALQPRRLQRALGDLDRRLAGDDRQRVDPRLAPEHGELLLRRGAGDVERGHQDALALARR